MPQSSDSPWGQQQVQGTSPLRQSQPTAVAEQGKSKKKKGKHAPSKEKNAEEAAESARPAEVAMSPPSLRPQSFGGYLPSGFPTIGEHIHQNHITSPVLEALGSMGAAAEDSAYRTDVWTQSVPIGKSPPKDILGGISTSESPPSQAPSRLSERGPPISTPPSSPPTRKARPVSYGSALPQHRSRPSSHDQASRYPYSNYLMAQPPLPHHPQAHFYGAPDIDLNIGSTLPHKAPDLGVSLLGFDIVPAAFAGRGKFIDQRVAMLRSHDRLDVITVQKNELKPIGCIDGLRGEVVDAKILTWQSETDPFASSRPLIAVVVHGQALDTDPSDSDDSSVALESETPRPSQRINAPGKAHNQPRCQTRVEVHSLRTHEQVSLLLATQPQEIASGILGSPPTVSTPIGGLKVESQGDFCTVTSAESGEIFVYTAEKVEDNASFSLIGKAWTTVKAKDVRRYSSSSASTATSPSPADPSRGQPDPEQALMSLSGRWLAIVPPGANVRSSLRAIIPLSATPRKPFGIDSYTAPPKPTPSALIDSPDADSLLNRVARGVAQEVVKGAGWLYEHGLQQWRSYRNQNTTSPLTTASIPGGNAMSGPASYFPPTHGIEVQTSSTTEPELVSLIDLSKLAHPPPTKIPELMEPIATFQPPGGCSFISFSPMGLSIMTSTKKGDVHYVWDLMQIVNVRMASIISGQPASVDPDKAEFPARVRQVARFSRFTDSSIIDATWTRPLGDRIAITSRNGTVHVHDLPYSSFVWPPLRRRIQHKSPAPADSSLGPISGSDEPKQPIGYLASAWKAASNTQPIFANIRGRAPSFHTTVSGLGTNSLSFAAGAGMRSGKALAAGVSRSVDTIDNLRHAGESRMKVQSLARDPAPNRVCWHVGDNEQPSLTVADGNVLRTCRVVRGKLKGRQGQGPSLTSVIDTHTPSEIRIPNLERLSNAAVAARRNAAEETGYSYCALPSPFLNFASARTKTPHPLSHAEIETNHPYQPFHSDHRVNLFTYSTPSSTPFSASPYDSDTNNASVILTRASSPPPPPPVQASIQPDRWVFGEPIPATRLNVRPARDADDERGGEIVYTEIREESGHEEGEKLVVTTRKKKGTRSAGAVGIGDDGEEIFEEDMEVVDWAGERV